MKLQIKKTQTSLLKVFAMIFILCSGGIYGMEDMISSLGPGMTVLLLLLLPICWSLPTVLVCCELGSALPEEGGYYKWVQRGLGEFWGFQAGWWYTLSSIVDTSLYVVLSTNYLNSFLHLQQPYSWGISFCLILFFTWVNIKGISAISLSSLLFTFVIMTPILLISFIGIFHWSHNPFVPFMKTGQGVSESLGTGFAIGIWLFSGWEAMSTMAGEIENPQKLIPQGLLITMPLIILLYILPTFIGLGSVGHWEMWSASGGSGAISFVEIGKILGGTWLGTFVLIASLVANLALYNNYLASSARTPFVMSHDNLFPKFLGKLHPKYETPYLAIFLIAGFHALLATESLKKLVVIDVMLFLFSYILIFLSAFALRIKEPHLPRVFRIPFGRKGLLLCCILPISCAVMGIYMNSSSSIWEGVIGLFSGFPLYYFFKKRYGGVGSSQDSQGASYGQEQHSLFDKKIM